MVNKLLNGIFSLVWSFVGIFTTPISDWLTTAIPDLSSSFAQINNFLNGLSQIISWFVYLIPRPLGILALSTFLLIVVSSQTLIVMIKISSWCIDLVKRIWIFGGK